MTSIAFDTYKAVKALKKAGFEEVQAEAVVATVSRRSYGRKCGNESRYG